MDWPWYLQSSGGCCIVTPTTSSSWWFYDYFKQLSNDVVSDLLNPCQKNQFWPVLCQPRRWDLWSRCQKRGSYAEFPTQAESCNREVKSRTRYCYNQLSTKQKTCNDLGVGMIRWNPWSEKNISAQFPRMFISQKFCPSKFAAILYVNYISSEQASFCGISSLSPFFSAVSRPIAVIPW